MFIHETSTVDQNVKIGKSSKIWHYCHISSGVIIGDNCILGQNVFIGKNVTIGNNVKIQNNVSVYEGVMLEDNVFCGPSVVFTNVKNPRSNIEKKNEFLKTLIKFNATLGANSTIICGNTIGEFSLIGAGSLITKDTKNFSLIIGMPGKQIGWVNTNGNKLNIPLEGNNKIKCKETGFTYVLSDNKLIKI